MPIESALRQWALQTSLKGVPRAMRADSCPSRWLWWFGTMGFLCLAFWQCGKLIEQFLQHNYAVTEAILTEKHDVDLHDVIEPVFTFCNLNPFDGNANIAIDKLGLYQLAYYTNFITYLTHCDGCPGARPTKHISIEFEIRWKFRMLWFRIYSTDHNDILHTSRQWHCRDVCKISLWSAAYILH